MATTYKPLESVLVKPAGPDCNLGCTYCFYLDKKDLFTKTPVHRMSEETLEVLIRQVMEQSGPQVSLAWQGGEPTLMGLDFYRKAVEFEKKYGQRKTVGNGFQTNGMLINEEWADFFKEYDFLIGLSLDGPQHIHDHYRLNKAGAPSHHRVEESAKLLLKKGIAVNAMCCVTSYSAERAEELYNYYKELGFEFMQFIPIVETDKTNPKKAADFSVTAEQYGNFLCDMFDLWLEDFKDGKPTTSIRHFDSIFYPYVGLPAPECALRRECGIYVTVEHNGEVYSCDFFVEPKWKLGNIHNGRLIDMLNSKKQHDFGMLKAKVPRKCKTCSWFKYCYGGCTKDRVKDPRDSMLPRFCESYTMFLEYADPVMKKLAANWKKEQEEMSQMEQQQQQQQQQMQNGTYNAFEDFVK